MIEDDNEICERCYSTYWEECSNCGGEGGFDGDDLMEEDPLWYSQDDYETCDWCKGKGGFLHCLGSCDENGKHEEKRIK